MYLNVSFLDSAWLQIEFNPQIVKISEVSKYYTNIYTTTSFKYTILECSTTFWYYPLLNLFSTKIHLMYYPLESLYYLLSKHSADHFGYIGHRIKAYSPPLAIM